MEDGSHFTSDNVQAKKNRSPIQGNGSHERPPVAGVLRDLRVALKNESLVETRHRVSKRGFRVLRDTTQGAALRICKPFEKDLSESFISPTGRVSLILQLPRLPELPQ